MTFEKEDHKLKYKLFALFVILLLAVAPAVMAATHANQTVSTVERTGKLMYSGTVTFADSASGAIYYTQAMYIGAVNAVDGYGYYICSEAGTEDVNVTYEYSFDAANWFAGTTDSDLDALGTTAVWDTVGIVQGADEVKYHGAVFYRIKFTAGQNMNSSTVTWENTFTKPAGLETKALGLVKSTS
jgi:hypothetical protein